MKGLAHLSDSAVADYCEGRLPAEGRREADEHLARCAECRQELEMVQGLREEFAAGRLAPPPREIVQRVLARGRARRAPTWEEVGAAAAGGEAWAERLREAFCAALSAQIAAALATRRRRSAVRGAATVKAQVLDQAGHDTGKVVALRVRGDTPLAVSAEGRLTGVVEAEEETFNRWVLQMLFSLPGSPEVAVQTQLRGRAASFAADEVETATAGPIPLGFVRFVLAPPPTDTALP